MVLVILAVGAAVRALYLAQVADCPLVERLLLDSATYDAWARQLIGGDWIGEGVFQSNPLYPYLLAGLYTVAGPRPETARWVQELGTLLACLALCRVAWLRLGRRAALATLTLAVLYGPLILIGGEILAESVVVLLLACALWLVVEAAGARGAGWALSLCAGLALGLACLGRPNLLPLAPLLVLFAATDGRPAWRRGLLRGAGVALGVTLAIAPVAGRNLVVAGEPVLITAHGGMNLWLGNNPDATGWFGVPRGSGLDQTQLGLLDSARRIAEEEQGRALTAREVSRWWSHRAMGYAVDQPGDWLKLTARKTGYVLNAYEKPLVASLALNRQHSSVLRVATVGYGVVLPLAVIGVIFTWHRRREHWILLATVAVALGTVVAFFVSMRYRLPVIVGLLPYAGAGLAGVVQRLQRDPPRAWIGWLVPLVLVGAVAHAPLPEQRVRDRAHTQYLLGNVAGEEAEWEAALEHYLAAVELRADEPGYWNNLGVAHGKLGHVDRELEAYRSAIEVDPNSAEAHFNLGVTLLVLGRADEALGPLVQASRLLPDEPMVAEQLAAARAAAAPPLEESGPDP